MNTLPGLYGLFCLIVCVCVCPSSFVILKPRNLSHAEDRLISLLMVRVFLSAIW